MNLKLVSAIEDDIEAGELTFSQIAVRHGVTYRVVNRIAEELNEQMIELDDSRGEYEDYTRNLVTDDYDYLYTSEG